MKQLPISFALIVLMGSCVTTFLSCNPSDKKEKSGQTVADAYSKPTRLDSLNKIMSSQHFSIIESTWGCWPVPIDKYDFYKTDSTWIMEFREENDSIKDFQLIYKIK